MEVLDEDRHQLGLAWRGNHFHAEERSLLFSAVLIMQHCLGSHRQDLRFGIVQKDPWQMGMGKDPCAHLQPGRVAGRLVLSSSQQCRLDQQNGQQEGGVSMQQSLAAGQCGRAAGCTLCFMLLSKACTRKCRTIKGKPHGPWHLLAGRLACADVGKC